VLTGTPLQNNLRELWALLHFLQPDIFTPATAEKFEEGFDLSKGRIDHRVLRKARQLLSIFMLRRIKENVAIKLPSKKEITILVPLTETQKMWYKQLLCGLDESAIEVVLNTRDGEGDQTPAEIVDETSTKKARMSSGNSSTNLARTSSTNSLESGQQGKSIESDWRKLMNLLLQLRKVCNHTYLMPDAEPDPYIITEDIVDGSGKLRMLDRILPRLRSDGHRVLIFSQFTSMLDILEEYMDFRKYPYARLDGETNRVQRRLDCRRYNAPKSNLFVFLISTRAGGLGLNLASADTVILYDSDWNPQVDLQAMERAHRIGQTKPVRVYRLICSGSVEERMINRAGKKLFLNAMVGETIADADDQM
jgi:SWI/SNF-related matrix-associated actin-dependent regulator of chromatin subfamily A member 5